MSNEELDLRNLKLELQKGKEPYNEKFKNKFTNFIKELKDLFSKEQNNEIEKIIFEDKEEKTPQLKTNLEEIKEKINNYNRKEPENIDLDIKLNKKNKENYLKKLLVWFESYIFSDYKTSPKKFKIRNRIILIIVLIIPLLYIFETDNGYEEKELNEISLIEKKYENIKEEYTKNNRELDKLKEKIYETEKEEPKEVVKTIEKFKEKEIKKEEEEKIVSNRKEIEEIIKKQPKEEIVDTKEEYNTKEVSVYSEPIVEEKKETKNIKQLFSNVKQNNNIDNVKTIEKQEITSNIKTKEEYYVIQVSVVKHLDKIDSDLKKIKSLNLNYRIEEITIKNELLYRVLVGKYKTKTEANSDLLKINKELKTNGFIKNFR